MTEFAAAVSTLRKLRRSMSTNATGRYGRAPLFAPGYAAHARPASHRSVRLRGRKAVCRCGMAALARSGEWSFVRDTALRVARHEPLQQIDFNGWR